MIQYLTHQAIDKNRWNECIRLSLNRRVYAFSWYLDLVCPGWEALAEEDYSAVFPLTGNRKWGISYLYQPFFTQQLGLFSVHPVTGSQLGDFLRAIPSKFRFAEIQLNGLNSFETAPWIPEKRVNHEMDISRPYTEISAGFSQNTRRNVRRSKEQNLAICRTTTAAELTGMFRDNYGKKEGKLRESHYLVIADLIGYCLEHDLGCILGAGNPDGKPDAAAFFLFDEAHVYFLFAASTADARENGAMFLLIDHFLAENAGKYGILDFEGGNDPNLGRFYKGFGAGEICYPSVSLNRLPRLAARFLYFARKIRQEGKNAIFVNVT